MMIDSIKPTASSFFPEIILVESIGVASFFDVSKKYKLWLKIISYSNKFYAIK